MDTNSERAHHVETTLDDNSLAPGVKKLGRYIMIMKSALSYLI